jgi:hypothetical protein
VHAPPTPFRMSSTLRKPDTTAFSAHRRAADQNAILCAAQQKRFGEPPRRAEHGRLHHKHTGKVIIKNGPASMLHRSWPMVRLSYRIGALDLGNHGPVGSPASDCCGHVRAGDSSSICTTPSASCFRGDTADPVSIGQSAQSERGNRDDPWPHEEICNTRRSEVGKGC